MYLIQDFFVQSDDEYYSFFFYKRQTARSCTAARSGILTCAWAT